MSIYDEELSRRNFLHRCACMAIGGATFASTMGSMQLASAALTDPGENFTDYRALVVVFLFGGNDAWNTVVPYTQSAYDTYAAARQNLSVPRAQLLPITPLTPLGTQFALHPNIPELQQLWQQDRLGIVANVGPLIVPTTKAEYQARSVPLPPQLFSHSDQTRIWQAVENLSTTKTGWAGRAADHLVGQIPTAEQQFAMNISLFGTNLLQTGGTSLPYNVSTRGITRLTGLNTDNADNTRRLAAFNSLLDLADANAHPFVREYSAVHRRARDTAERIKDALDALTPFTTIAPTGNRLADQLEMVAKLIAIRSTLNVRRQVFFVGTGGFDTHGDQNNRHPNLLTGLSQALKYFYDVTAELTVQDNVTTFTNSDFGRTLTSNGDGSDHGWGGHAFVMGGSVRGRDFYGTMPTYEIDGPDDTRGGRLIPTTSVDQYGATVCRWFGVTDPNLNVVFPNLTAFSTRDLGFML